MSHLNLTKTLFKCTTQWQNFRFVTRIKTHFSSLFKICHILLNKTDFTEAHLVNVCLTGGINGFLQFGRVDFDVLAESLAGLSQILTGFW